MADLYTLSFEDILDYLVELGKRLAFDQNQHVREAFRLSCITSGLSESKLRFHSSHLGAMFDRTDMRRIMQRACGVEYLEAWVDQGHGAFPISEKRGVGQGCVSPCRSRWSPHH